MLGESEHKGEAVVMAFVSNTKLLGMHNEIFKKKCTLVQWSNRGKKL